MLRSRFLFTSVVALILVGVGFALVMNTPAIVSRLTYAAENGRAQAATEQLKTATDLSEAFKYVAKAMRPSVVSVRSVKVVKPHRQFQGRPRSPFPREFEEFFGDDFSERFHPFPMPDRGYEQRGLGTGVIVSADGYVVTNSHVVRGADEVTVTLSDGRELTASIVGMDEKTDIAVLQIEGTNFPAAELGDSDAMEVGEWVLAVGSPFGLAQTVTAGIVSAKGRADVGVAEYEDFLQTDAAINPGNSGGPLVNLRGEVIGINTAIASQTGGYMGIGFAIPSNMVRSVMNAIIHEGKVRRGWLGAAIQDLSADLAESFDYDSRDGVLVGDVVPDSPAAKAGLKSGDIIVQFDGTKATSANHLRNTVAATAPGTKVDMIVFRDGRRKTLEVAIGLLESDTIAKATGAGSDGGDVAAGATSWGMTVRTLTPQIAKELGYEREISGVVVTAVEPAGLGTRAGIRQKDIIVRVGSTAITSAADFRKATEEADLSRGIRMQVVSEGMMRFVFLRSSR